MLVQTLSGARALDCLGSCQLWRDVHLCLRVALDGIWLLMKFVVRSMVVAGWWAQQSGVVNEKMEREDGIYKKDLPTQSLSLTLTFQDSTLK